MTQSELSQILQKEKGASKKWKIWLFLAAILLMVAAFFIWRSTRASSNNNIRYITEPLVRGDLRVTVTAVGNLEPTNEITIGSELSGTVKEVYVDTNDQVTKGQPLAKLDTSKLERQTDSSRANAAAATARVAQAKATLVETESNLVRLQKLHEASGGKVPSQAELDAAIALTERAKADLESAGADVRQAEANIGTNESDLEKSVIISPIDGIILVRDIEPGQTVAATMTAPELFIVAEKLENMKLEVAVAEADIGRVKEGQNATFTVDAWPNRTFNASVKKVEFGSKVTDNVVTYTTELEVSNDDLSLRPGMTATAEIAVAEAENVFLIPNAALRFSPVSATVPSTAPAAQRGGGSSFIQNLVPQRRRRSSGSSFGNENAGPRQRQGEVREIYFLKNGKPETIKVKTGLTDGRVTEISASELEENALVITHSQAIKK